MIRQAVVERRTSETEVRVELRLESGDIKVNTPIKFLNHMLETLIFYMGVSGSINAVDLRGFDDHHIVEDIATVLGTAIDKALGDRVGIARFGWSIVPMDDALALVAVDLGGRSYFTFDGSFSRCMVGDLSTEMVPHFIRSFATSSRATIHVKLLNGENDHHKIEAIFRALGLSLRQAMQIVSDKAMSLKGVLL